VDEEDCIECEGMHLEAVEVGINALMQKDQNFLQCFKYPAIPKQTSN
jgi:hypothetical protein